MQKYPCLYKKGNKGYNRSTIWSCSVEKVFSEILQKSRPPTLLKDRLWHRCFPVNFAKFLRKSFFTEHLQWLLLIHTERDKEGQRDRDRETERQRGERLRKENVWRADNLKYDSLSLTRISCNKLWQTPCSILFLNIFLMNVE